MFVKRFDVTYPLLTLVPELVSSLENVKIRMKHVLNVLMYIKKRKFQEQPQIFWFNIII